MVKEQAPRMLRNTAELSHQRSCCLLHNQEEVTGDAVAGTVVSGNTTMHGSCSLEILKVLPYVLASEPHWARKSRCPQDFSPLGLAVEEFNPIFTIMLACYVAETSVSFLTGV